MQQTQVFLALLLQTRNLALQGLDLLFQQGNDRILFGTAPTIRGATGDDQNSPTQGRRNEVNTHTDPPTPKFRKAVLKALKGLMTASPRMMAQPNQWK